MTINVHIHMRIYLVGLHIHIYLPLSMSDKNYMNHCIEVTPSKISSMLESEDGRKK